MGIFDIFKKKQQGTEPSAEVENKQAEPYLGDLDKTDIIFQLVQTPQAERNQEWAATLVKNVAQASFRCGDPQVITGPDGFPYFQLLLPEPNKQFQCFVIDRMKDDFLLKSGFGVVINPTDHTADWVFTYGDILNLHLNKTFYTTDDDVFSKDVTDEKVAQDEQVLVAQPSESLLPRQTRQLIAEFLNVNGVKHQPKVLLMNRKNKNSAGAAMDIVFNITPQSLDDAEKYRSLMSAIGWFLPSHYSYMGMEEHVMPNDFAPL